MEALVVLAFAVPLLIVLVWMLRCNKKTLKQRLERLRCVSESAQRAIDSNDKDWERFYRVFEEVDYDDHFWHLVTFRDPSRLYEKHAHSHLRKVA